MVKRSKILNKHQYTIIESSAERDKKVDNETLHYNIIRLLLTYLFRELAQLSSPPVAAFERLRDGIRCVSLRFYMHFFLGADVFIGDCADLFFLAAMSSIIVNIVRLLLLRIRCNVCYRW